MEFKISQVHVNDFPDDGPVKAEVGMDSLVAEATNLSPRNLGNLSTQLLAQARGRFTDNHELAEDVVSEDLVLSLPITMSVDPAADGPASSDNVREVERVTSRITRHTGPQRR